MGNILIKTMFLIVVISCAAPEFLGEKDVSDKQIREDLKKYDIEVTWVDPSEIAEKAYQIERYNFEDIMAVHLIYGKPISSVDMKTSAFMLYTKNKKNHYKLHSVDYCYEGLSIIDSLFPFFESYNESTSADGLSEYIYSLDKVEGKNFTNVLELSGYDKRVFIEMKIQEEENLSKYLGDTVALLYVLNKHNWKNNKIISSEFTKEFKILKATTPAMRLFHGSEELKFIY